LKKTLQALANLDHRRQCDPTGPSTATPWIHHRGEADFCFPS
jgi:hypothetical protein